MPCDAMRAARTNYKSRPNSLHLTIGVQQFDKYAFRIRFHLRCSYATLNQTAERCQMSLQNPLRFVLRQTALILAATVDAVMVHRTQLRHVRTVHSRTVNVLCRFDERREQPDRFQNLKRPWLNSGCPSFAMRLQISLDNSRLHAVTR